jgi:hypothetical protein
LKRSSKKTKEVVGWREWVSLPNLNINEIKAKIDTGARSSALHAFDIKKFRRGRRDMIRFKVYPYQRDAKLKISAEAELLGERRIRSSSGKEEVRPVIRTSVRLLDREWMIELTLTNRVQMGFRLLLGRQAVRNRFLIDPGRSFRSSRMKASGFSGSKKQER